MSIKTHTFKLGTYTIDQTERINGICDTPDPTSWKKATKEMLIIEGADLRALHSALHEALHADGIPDEYIHDKDGCADTMRIARFLWRLGYRKVVK